MIMPLPHPNMNNMNIEISKNNFKITSGSSHSISFIFMTKSPIEIKKMFLKKKK